VGLVSTTLRLLRPWGSGLIGVTTQVPLGCTVDVAMVLLVGSLMAMVLPGVPVPLMVGVVSLVSWLPLAPLSLMGSRMSAGAAGAVDAMAAALMLKLARLLMSGESPRPPSASARFAARWWLLPDLPP
jgi:hypothetical protein